MSRWPLVRHIRYFWHKYQMLRWYDQWAQFGMHSGNMEHDIAVLNKIWKGEL